MPLVQLLPIVMKAKPPALLFEAANPRHAHEWAVFRDNKIPDDKILIPGVLSSTTNYVEHPEHVAERLVQFAEIVGRERVLAGSDCGFSTFAGFGPVDPDVHLHEARIHGAGRAARQAASGSGSAERLTLSPALGSPNSSSARWVAEGALAGSSTICRIIAASAWRFAGSRSDMRRLNSVASGELTSRNTRWRSVE